MKRIASAALVGSLAWLLAGPPALAQEVDGCKFAWDVAHELTVLKQAPQSVTAGAKPGADSPVLRIDKPYQLKLVAQNSVTYAVKPAKPTLNDSVQGGLVRFKVDKAGLYRVSITSGHWIDVVDGSAVVKSKDFTGSRGCDRVHKIVEFDLPAGRDLVLQFSGSTDAQVLMAITPVTGAPSH
ncbi:MAG TPA: hypothetical protein VGM84_06280 [Steroidobacteraceae bacterium]|jgi:hypothetical protein